MINQESIRREVQLAVAACLLENNMGAYIPAAVSARHAHLSEQDMAVLFGSGYQLKKLRDLEQPGQFVCHEKVTLIGPKGRFDGIRVLGPTRSQTQVELSLTDCYKAGIQPVVRMSGDLKNTPGATLIGPAGQITLNSGIIVAARHLHISAEQAERYNLKNGDIIRARKNGDREIVFGNIVVRAGSDHELELHLDTDEANAAGIFSSELLELLR